MRKITWTNLHATQHPFNDVAVVAQQSARGACVVAMVGSDLPAFKRAMAYSTLVLLKLKQSFERCGRYSCPSGALSSEMCGPSFGICFFHFAQLYGALLGFLRLGVLTSLFSDAVFRVVKSAALLYFWSRVVFAKPLSFALYIFKSAQAVVLQMCGPFFWGGGRFSFSHLRSLTIKTNA